MKKKSKIVRRFAVIDVYEEGDGIEPLVHVAEVFGTAAEAKRFAKARAVDTANRIGDPFDEVWEEVDNGEKDWVFRDWGYSPIDGSASFSIRVACWEEPVCT